MAVIALVGLPGAPGTTTTALALLRVWPLEGGWRMVLAECDPDGGAVLPGALSGRIAADRGLPNLAVSTRTQGQELVASFWTQLMAVGNSAGDHSRLLLPGLAHPSQASSLTPVWNQLADLFTGIEKHQHDVIVDLGRSGAFGPSSVLAARADAVVLVVRGTLRSIHAAKARIDMLRSLLDDADGREGDPLAVLLITEGTYGPREVEKELRTPVVATLPHRPKEAAVLSDGSPEGRGFTDGELMRAARTAADGIQQHAARRRARVTAPLFRWLGVVGDAR
ncbi:hypothetical protein [Streptomyces sp. NPDC020681]|uniref:hypothetical protein n=1 Tax=Streptomyces sp. NPDC020681 TaxID=3365083 RepID=UPI0037945AB6